MIADIRKLLDHYINWVKDNTKIRKVEDWVEITTPYVDRHNDYLQIYVKRDNSSLVLTDDGYIIQDLENSGCKLESKKRQDLLAMTLNGFGIKKVGNALEVEASRENFNFKKHNLIQAMLAVNDLFYLAGPMVINLFLEDVTLWMELNEIRYVSKVKFTGKSGLDHTFDFAIPASKEKPERIIRAINRPDNDTAQAMAFAWIDTKGVRQANSKAYAILNDTDKNIQSSVITALKNYDVNPIFWSKRDNFVGDLAA
ncbi:MAG: DUF1829 domain-containing protein [Syntrophales bacterium]